MVSWPYPDPGALLGRRLGLDDVRTAVSTVGGNSPQLLVNAFARDIAAGDANAVLIGGALMLADDPELKTRELTGVDETREHLY